MTVWVPPPLTVMWDVRSFVTPLEVNWIFSVPCDTCPAASADADGNMMVPDSSVTFVVELFVLNWLNG